MKGTFRDIELRIVRPTFDSQLTDLVLDLDYLRRRVLHGTTKPFIFFQMKRIFHLLESIGSARIEGNNTTIAEFIETKIDGSQGKSKPNILEIENMEKAMAFIDSTIGEAPINRAFVSELHRMVVTGLPILPEGEGDRTPGEYRNFGIEINKSSHRPPEFQAMIIDYMENLFQFINENCEPKYDLIKIALVHHRFMWIHPFGNGNGRTGRLLTYAMLVKQGFRVNTGRIINPTAVFCINRDEYYKKLSIADKGADSDLLEWCQFVLSGLKDEIEKIDKLLDHDYLKKEIVIPAINYSLERKQITDKEARILRLAINSPSQIIQNSDIKEQVLKGKLSSEVSRSIKRLKDKKMLCSFADSPRRYYIGFDNSYLLRGIIHALGEKGFLAVDE